MRRSSRGARLQRMERIYPCPRQPSVQRGRPCQWAKPMISNSNPDLRLSSGSTSFARRGRRAHSRRSLFRSMSTEVVLSAAMQSTAAEMRDREGRRLPPPELAAVFPAQESILQNPSKAQSTKWPTRFVVPRDKQPLCSSAAGSYMVYHELL